MLGGRYRLFVLGDGVAMARCLVLEFVGLFSLGDVEFVVGNCLGCGES
jgi:hypothetical protein